MNILDRICGQKPECHGHDYGEWTQNWGSNSIRFRTSPDVYGVREVLKIQPAKTKRCQREGCNESKEARADWHMIPINCISEPRELKKARFLEEAAKMYDNIDGEGDLNEYRLRLVEMMEEY